MARTTTATVTIDRFTYAPGDGYRYAWRGPVIVVEKIITEGSKISFRPTGDTIPVPALVTITAFAHAVDAWRWDRLDWSSDEGTATP